MVSQYQIHQVVEAVQFHISHYDDEYDDILGDGWFVDEGASTLRQVRISDLKPLPNEGDWLVRTLHKDFLIIPDDLFRKLYTKVNE